jgi:precorrin-6A/cobalt-precorrin-6A reductase
MMRILILSGTTEASALAEACAGRAGLEVISSLAGRTRAPRALPGEVRVGGFGGADGLARFLQARAVDRLIDASHPFAEQIGRHAERACRMTGVPRLRLLRPPWQRRADDLWVAVADLAEAARRLPEFGRRAFLTVGHRDLGAFAGLADVWFLVRTIEVPARLPLQRALWLQGRGPFPLEAELALLRDHAIDVLVTKASGGEATYAKIAAARELGLPVIMTQRPPPPPGPVVSTVAEALDWLDRS